MIWEALDEVSCISIKQVAHREQENTCIEDWIMFLYPNNVYNYKNPTSYAKKKKKKPPRWNTFNTQTSGLIQRVGAIGRWVLYVSRSLWLAMYGVFFWGMYIENLYKVYIEFWTDWSLYLFLSCKKFLSKMTLRLWFQWAGLKSWLAKTMSLASCFNPFYSFQVVGQFTPTVFGAFDTILPK